MQTALKTEQHWLPLESGGSYSWLASKEDWPFIELAGRGKAAVKRWFSCWPRIASLTCYVPPLQQQHKQTNTRSTLRRGQGEKRSQWQHTGRGLWNGAEGAEEGWLFGYPKYPYCAIGMAANLDSYYFAEQVIWICIDSWNKLNGIVFGKHTKFKKKSYNFLISHISVAHA